MISTRLNKTHDLPFETLNNYHKRTKIKIETIPQKFLDT